MTNAYTEKYKGQLLLTLLTVVVLTALVLMLGVYFWDDIKAKVQKESGFRPDTVRVEMGGECKECQRKGGSR